MRIAGVGGRKEALMSLPGRISDGKVAANVKNRSGCCRVLSEWREKQSADGPNCKGECESWLLVVVSVVGEREETKTS